MNKHRITDIATYVPEGRVDTGTLCQEFGVAPSFIERKTGFRNLARCSPSEGTTELAVRAFENLAERNPGLAERVGALVVITQNPDGRGLPHASARVHGALDLPKSVAAFDISLGCSGWVYGLSICLGFLAREGIDVGVLITADPYSAILAPGDRDTGLLFGDAATATLIETTGAGWMVGKSVFGTDGGQSDALERREDGYLHMNGRRVFEFSASVVPKCVSEVLERNRLQAEAIDLFLMHQGSRYIVDFIAKEIKAPERTPFVSNQIGNTVSSSIPLALASGTFNECNRILAVGFGVGLSWAGTILEKCHD